MKDITKEWLDFAETDLKCCKNNLFDESLTNVVAFHSQQAVEKCFKAIIEENEIDLPRIHNLINLHKIVKNLTSFPIELDLLTTLDEVYTSSRYPGELGLMPNGKPSKKVAEKLYNFAKFIYVKTMETIEN
jgi:HEPN domain-containing protein